MKLWELLEKIQSKLDYLTDNIELEEYSSIEEAINKAYLEKPEWNRVNNVVAIFADLADSTSISNRKIKRVYAKFLEYIGYPFVKINNEFDAEFIDIKGDGGIALFSGKYAEIKAFLSAETFKTFQEKYAKDYFKKYDVSYYLGIGIAKGDLLVKKIGQRGDKNYYVWAGNAINNAALVSKDLKRVKQNMTTIGVTEDIYHTLDTNTFRDYLIFSCGCPNSKKVKLWKEFTVSGESNFKYHLIESNWCEKHGEEYVRKVLEVIQKDD